MDNNSKKALIDKGFDEAYSNPKLNKFSKTFSNDELIFKVIQEIRDEENTIDIKRGEFYPEILRCVHSLKTTISEIYKLPYNQCQPNFGSNGSIDTILTAMKVREAEKGLNTIDEGGLLVATPTYFRNYNSSMSKKIKIHGIPLNEKWKIDIDFFINQIKVVKPTVIFLVTPNNPTGIAIEDKDIQKIIDNTPNDTMIVIDRTLVNINKEISSTELLKNNKIKQIAILHSFSKYCGLSHLRIGFALYSNNEIADEIKPFLPLGITIEGALKAVSNLKRNKGLLPMNEIIMNIKQNKEILNEFCINSNQFQITDFSGNYCLMILKEKTSEEITNYLSGNGIYIMGGHEFPEPNNNVVRLHTGGKPDYVVKMLALLNRL